MIQTELIEHLVESVVERDGHRALDQVGTQVDPLFEVVLDHVQDEVFSRGLARKQINIELLPGNELVGRRLREAIALVILKLKLFSGL